MATTTSDLAVRNGTVDARQQAALAIKPGQLTWDKFQEAALAQIGLREASNADRAVFLHQCQRTGLDPFSRQIYMIGRWDAQLKGLKWTIQTGIDGWRVIRDRAEKREGVRGVLSRFTYYDHEDNEKKVWTRAEPPAAIEVTYTVRDRNGVETPYTSVLRHDEYVQTNKDGQPVAKWATMDVHMLEKCTEADVYRKAFPQDFSGVHLEDAMPPAESGAPERQRVTADQARARGQQHQAPAPQPEPVDAEIVEEEPPPWADDAPPADDDPRNGVIAQFGRLKVTSTPGMCGRAARLLNIAVPSLDTLTRDEADQLIELLAGCQVPADLDALLAEREGGAGGGE